MTSNRLPCAAQVSKSADRVANRPFERRGTPGLSDELITDTLTGLLLPAAACAHVSDNTDAFQSILCACRFAGRVMVHELRTECVCTRDGARNTPISLF